MTPASDNLATLVEGMLQDAGCGQETELRDALLSLGSLASLPAPAPTGELAALLAGGGMPPAEETVPAAQREDDLARRRRRRIQRPTALGLVLAAGMGLGVGGVAASSSGPGSSAIEHLLEDWAPWGNSTGGASAGSSGYRAPAVAAAGDLTDAGSSAATGGAADAVNPASRLLGAPAGLSGLSSFPPCAGPVKHDAGSASATCAAGPTWAAAQGNNRDGRNETAGPAASHGTPAGQGFPWAWKAEAPASNTSGDPDATGAAPQKAGGSTRNAGQGTAQGGVQSSGESQGNAQKAASPAK